MHLPAGVGDLRCMMAGSMKGQAVQTPQHLQRAAQQLMATQKARHSASKYDFVKVKVWVGENLVHYYILSRFLISRMLTVTKIPQMKAVKIALEVKKYLVDNDLMDISQDHFEAILFDVMQSRGFGDEYLHRYKMVTNFFQQRRPLIVLICGVPCTGKSSLAQQLASRLNMPNVLQTDALYELMRMTEDGPLQLTPLWHRADLEGPALVREFLRESRIVRKGLDGSLAKCLTDGKSIIMEGMHLDPGLYLYEFARYSQAHLTERMRGRKSLRNQEPGSVSPEQGVAARCMPSGTAAAEAAIVRSKDDLRVGTRSASAMGAQLAHGPDPDLEPQVTRRSASFILSSAARSAGRMSPMLTRGSQLVHRDPDAQPMSPGAQNRQEPSASGKGGAASRKASNELPIPGQLGAEAAAQKANSFEAGSFLSLSPTMQWLQMATKGGKAVLQLPLSKPQQKGSFTFSASPSKADRPPHHSSSTAPGQLNASNETSQERVQPGIVRQGSTSTIEEWQCRQAGQKTSVTSAHGTSATSNSLGSSASSHAKHQQDNSCRSLTESSDLASDVKLATRVSQLSLAEGKHAGMQKAQQPASTIDGKHQDAARAPQAVQNGSKQDLSDTVASSPSHAANAHDTKRQISHDAASCSPSSREVPAAEELFKARRPVGKHQAPPISSSTTAGDGSGRRHMPKDSGLQPGPVFVPIVLTMDDTDHELLVEEWLLRQASSQASGAPLNTDEVLSRLRLLQSHLCAYAQRSVPVINLNLANFNDTLDELHDYLLLCIQLALEEDEVENPTGW